MPGIVSRSEHRSFSFGSSSTWSSISSSRSSICPSISSRRFWWARRTASSSASSTRPERPRLLFLEGLASPSKLLKAALRRLRRFPWPRILPSAETSDQGRIGRIGLRSLQLARRVSLDSPRIDDTDPIAFLVQTIRNRLFKVAAGLHAHAGLLRLGSSIFEPAHQDIVSFRIVGNRRSRDDFLAVAQGQFQSCLTNVNPQSKSKFGSGSTRSGSGCLNSVVLGSPVRPVR